MKGCAAIYSAGKDSHLALLLAARRGRAACLVNYDGGARHEKYFNDFRKPAIVEAHAFLLGVPALLIRTGASFEVKDMAGNAAYCAAAARDAFGADSLVIGAASASEKIELADWRRGAASAGLRLKAPLAGSALLPTVRLCLKLGVSAMITGLDPRCIPTRWLGRGIDGEFLSYLVLESAAGRPVDGNNLQTLVLGSPAFAGRIEPLKFSAGGRGGQRFLRVERFRVVRGRRKWSVA